jgi:hypothetical protein
MLLTAVYTLFGPIIPTMIDEALVYILLVSLVIFGLLTGLAFHAVYIRLFSVIVFLIKAVEKWRAKIEKYRVKKRSAGPVLEDSQPLQPDEMEEPGSILTDSGMAQAEGQQV